MKRPFCCRFLLLLALITIPLINTAALPVKADQSEEIPFETDSDEQFVPDASGGIDLFTAENDGSDSASMPETANETGPEQDFELKADLESPDPIVEKGNETLTGKAADPMLSLSADEQPEPITSESLSRSGDLQPVASGLTGMGEAVQDYDGYRLIETYVHLNAVRIYLNDSYRLANDIEIPEGTNWSPVGTSADPFTGIFDGLNFTISGLFISGGDDYFGLFGYASGATIKDLTLDVESISGGDYTGGLIGRADNSSISNCTVITATQPTSGISGKQNVGGLIGYADDSAVSNCTVSGQISSTDSYVGGLIGYLESSTLAGSSSESDVTGQKNFVGGLVGAVRKSDISESFSAGSVTGNDGVGGLVGHINSVGGSTIENSYAAGFVSGIQNTGGLLGRSAGGNTIILCHSVALVECRTNDRIGIGGLVGSSHSNSLLLSQNNYWDFENSNQEFSAMGLGLSGNQMKDAANFTGFDFEEIWYLTDGLSYPVLKWQINEIPPVPEPPGDSNGDSGSGDGDDDQNLSGSNGSNFSSNPLEYFTFPFIAAANVQPNLYAGSFFFQLIKMIARVENLVDALNEKNFEKRQEIKGIIVESARMINELFLAYRHLLDEQEQLIIRKRIESLQLAIKFL